MYVGVGRGSVQGRVVEMVMVMLKKVDERGKELKTIWINPEYIVGMDTEPDNNTRLILTNTSVRVKGTRHEIYGLICREQEAKR